MTKMRNDFKVYPYTSTAEPDIERWQVRSGTTTVYVTTRSQSAADHVAAALNIDPYYLERGNTQLDRANMQAPHKKD
jgi:hypothetical protein